MFDKNGNKVEGGGLVGVRCAKGTYVGIVLRASTEFKQLPDGVFMNVEEITILPLAHKLPAKVGYQPIVDADRKPMTLDAKDVEAL